MKKDEKDAGSRSWNASIVLASFESGCSFLNLRSRDCSWRVGREKATRRGGARFVFCFCFVVRWREICALHSHLGQGRVVLPLLLLAPIRGTYAALSINSSRGAEQAPPYAPGF